MNAETAALLSHFCVIQSIAWYPRPFHVPVASWCKDREWRIECKENGHLAQKISKEVRVMKWLQSKRDVSKTVTMSGIAMFIKVPQLSSCHSDSLWTMKNASADTEENSILHYSTNNSNNRNNSSNKAGTAFTFARSLLIILFLSLQFILLSLSVPWEATAVTIKSHFVHN